MAPIGLAHRPDEEAATRSGHGDPETVDEPDARLHDLVEHRRADPAITQDRSTAPTLDEPSVDGWLAGEPMF